jgi:hypothetical protein
LNTSSLLLLAAAAGCAAIGCTPAPGPAASGLTRDGPAAKPPEASVSRQAETAAKPPTVPAAAPETAAKPVAPAPPPSVAGDVPAPKAPAPVGQAPARPGPAAGAPAPKKEAVAPARATPPAAPPLDLASLEKRLKETEAIGVFTKLTLKNQVDDLLASFKAHHGGRANPTLAELRQRFDLLILKVRALLQDRDASLAAAVVASRDALWGILSDPVKFKTVVEQNKG